ncbi:MAG: HD domain-containing protein [Candidatus Aenigmarchaeota archaeon]|nr:HD domain-containing protein [Candidatus Aenigmarchaeota archaeon]
MDSAEYSKANPKISGNGIEYDDPLMYSDEKIKEILRSMKGETFRQPEVFLDWLFKKMESLGVHTMWLGHSVKVGELAEEAMQELAGYADFKKKKYPSIRMGGMLHDVGKILAFVGEDRECRSLNGEIRMTDKDLKYMRLHTLVGRGFIEAMDPKGKIGINRDEINECVLYHHEDWSGSGYPSKLKGEEIPKCARLLRVIDFIDAAGDKTRLWHPTLSHHDIRERLKADEGVMYDPVFAGIFYGMLGKKQIHDYLHLSNGHNGSGAGAVKLIQ